MRKGHVLILGSTGQLSPETAHQTVYLVVSNKPTALQKWDAALLFHVLWVSLFPFVIFYFGLLLSVTLLLMSAENTFLYEQGWMEGDLIWPGRDILYQQGNWTPVWQLPRVTNVSKVLLQSASPKCFPFWRAQQQPHLPCFLLFCLFSFHVYIYYQAGNQSLLLQSWTERWVRELSFSCC